MYILLDSSKRIIRILQTLSKISSKFYQHTLYAKPDNEQLHCVLL